MTSAPQIDDLPSAPAGVRREDVLVSVCFPDTLRDPEGIDAARALAEAIKARYRYFEILVIVDATAVDAFADLARNIANLRLVVVRAGLSIYRKRVVAAAEAIGDIVLLADADELPALRAEAMLERARREKAIVLAQRRRKSWFEPLIRGLGNASGFRVSTRDMRTAVYPRTQLNLLLGYPDRQIALRFPPRDSGVPIRYVTADGSAGSDLGSWREVGRRVGLVQKLLVNAAPLVLGVVSILSILVILAGILFAVYAFIVWATYDAVQPGWFTTTVAISLTSSYLGAAILGLSSALQRLVDIATPELTGEVVDEISATDLFGDMSHDLNVEVDVSDARLSAGRESGAMRSRQG